MEKVNMSERDFFITLQERLLASSKSMNDGTPEENLYNSSLKIAMETGFDKRDFDSDTHLVNVCRTLNTERINTAKMATSEGKIKHKEENAPGIYVTEKLTYQDEFKQEFDKLSFTAEQSEYNSKMLAMYQGDLEKMKIRREEFISIIEGLNLPISEKTKIYDSFHRNILLLVSHLITRHQIENRINDFQHKQHEPAAESRYKNVLSRDVGNAAWKNNQRGKNTEFHKAISHLLKKENTVEAAIGKYQNGLPDNHKDKHVSIAALRQRYYRS